MKEVSIAVDGACEPNPGPGGWGAVLYLKTPHGIRTGEASGHADDTTNNRMEIAAAIGALATLTEPCKVRLASDSHYLIQTMNGAYARKTNMDMWKALDNQVEQHKVTWVKLPREHPALQRPHELANARIKE